MSYGLTVEARTDLRDLEVVECGHSEVNVAKGYCSFCGKLYAGKITDKNGAVRYVEKWQNDDFADGNTVTLLQSVGIIAPESSCTIEMNGRAADMINFLVPGGTPTLKGDGNIGVVVIGYQDIDSMLVIEDKAYWRRIEIGTLFVNKTTNTKLTGGRFGMIERKDGGFVEELLAEGYAFFDPVWDDPFYLPGKTSLDKTYYIAAHEHWFDVDSMTGETVCKCGLICRHTTIGADGKCTDVCKRQIYVAVLTKADETETKYEAFADAFAAAAESEDAILTLLCDVDLDGDELTLDHGKFTLDLGSYTLKNFAHHQVLAVSGTADIVIKNGVLHNTFNTTKGGQLFVSTGNAIDIRGGSLTLEKADGSKIATLKSPVADEIMPSFDLAAFGAEHSGQYLVRAEFCGYVLYSDTFTITIAECEHPGFDRSTGKCTQCRCDLAAAIVKSGKTTGYVNFADALAVAQTEENRHCELWLLTDVTGKIMVSTGDFILRMNGHTVGAVNVTKIGMLDMRGGTVTGAVTVAKNTTALLNATGVTFKGTVNANGSNGSFADRTFAGALIEKIRALADSKNDTPKTGEMSDLALWFALLFVSGGAFAGIRLAGKKKTEE